MKYTALLIGFFLLLAPSLTSAQEQAPTCSEKGYTVVFINGIFGTEETARTNKDNLQQAFIRKNGLLFKGETVNFQLGYNPSHLAGASDVLQTITQLFGRPVSSFDLNTILLQIHPEVTTRKLILVGHSQGTLYSNEMYQYMLAHGEPKDALDVYNIASVDSKSVGSGKYLNSSSDRLLQTLRLAHFTLLPNNIDLDVGAINGNNFQGHGFTDVYLAQAADIIVGDIEDEMSVLKPTDATASGDCFTPPTTGFGYKAEQISFAIADPTATVIKVGAVTTYNVGSLAFKAAATFAEGAFQFVGDAFSVASTPPTNAETTSKTNTIVNKLYGSSLSGLNAQDKKDLLGNAQGGAVALAAGGVLGTFTEVEVDEVSASSSTQIFHTPGNIFPDTTNGPAAGVAGGGGGGGSAAPTIVTPAPEPIVIEPVVEQETIVSDPPPPPLPTGAPFTDNFDTYSENEADSAWSVFPTPNHTLILFGADTGSVDQFRDATTSSSDCYSGSCIIAAGRAGGIGSFGYESYMYRKSGVGQSEGAFTIWARARPGWRNAAAHVAICITGSSCLNPDILMFESVAPNDDVWHQFYIAWRQGSSSIETCLLQDTTNGSSCAWTPQNFPLGTQFDGILLAGGVVRPDLGDQVWFDDIEEAPAQ